VLKVDALPGPPGPEQAPVLSIFGGKITTYRKLAEHALRDLAPYFPGLGPAWTASATLPGGDLPRRDRTGWNDELCRRYPKISKSGNADLNNSISERAASSRPFFCSFSIQDHQDSAAWIMEASQCLGLDLLASAGADEAVAPVPARAAG
jgi:glycerol-3-phosphate dehydrogenase